MPHSGPYEPQRIVLIVDGQRRTYVADEDGLMWSYRTAEGRRWIGWRTLAARFEQTLSETAAAGSTEPGDTQDIPRTPLYPTD